MTTRISFNGHNVTIASVTSEIDREYPDLQTIYVPLLVVFAVCFTLGALFVTCIFLAMSRCLCNRPRRPTPVIHQFTIPNPSRAGSPTNSEGGGIQCPAPVAVYRDGDLERNQPLGPLPDPEKPIPTTSSTESGPGGGFGGEPKTLWMAWLIQMVTTTLVATTCGTFGLPGSWRQRREESDLSG